MTVTSQKFSGIRPHTRVFLRRVNSTHQLQPPTMPPRTPLRATNSKSKHRNDLSLCIRGYIVSQYRVGLSITTLTRYHESPESTVIYERDGVILPQRTISHSTGAISGSRMSAHHLRLVSSSPVWLGYTCQSLHGPGQKTKCAERTKTETKFSPYHL